METGGSRLLPLVPRWHFTSLAVLEIVGLSPVRRFSTALIFSAKTFHTLEVEPLSVLCGSFFKVFEEEHHILYLDHGGVIVAIKDTSIPLKILK